MEVVEAGEVGEVGDVDLGCVDTDCGASTGGLVEIGKGTGPVDSSATLSVLETSFFQERTPGISRGEVYSSDMSRTPVILRPLQPIALAFRTGCPDD